MTKNKSESIQWAVRLMLCGLLLTAVLACSAGSDTASIGGMSGTGISQGSIDSFGSIFVNGVEWEIASAQIEVDDATGTEVDLRVGMVVLVRGDLDPGGISGIATSVQYDDELEGPIETDPILVMPMGREKSFAVLGRTVIVDEFDTNFGTGVSFASIARLDVVEVSGFVDGAGVVRASRIDLMGQFPTVDEVELKGVVANLMKNGDGTGLFEIGSITVEYTGATTFTDITEADLVNGDVVEAKGPLVGGGFDRIDAIEIELEDENLAAQDATEFEIEGIVSGYVSLTDFNVSGIPVDASGASINPMGAVLTDGDLVEVDGSLVAGVLVADSVDVEDDSLDDVNLSAAISSIDTVGRSLTLLGVDVVIDGQTEFEDERDDLPNFGFNDLQTGDWLNLEAISTGGGAVLATKVERDDADADVVLEGPVSALDGLIPALSILDQPIPLDGMTAYFDDQGQPRTEEEFFRNPGDIQSTDVVKITDVGAVQLDALLEADTVEIQD